MFFRLLIFLLLPFTAQSQKQTSRVFDAGSIQTIVLNSDEIYKISLKTAAVNDITVKTRSDGEYFNQIGVEAEVGRSTLFLSSKYPEILKSGYDKLSAHKVLSIELEIVIPEQMNVEIRSNLASVYMNGSFREVFIQLKSGLAFLSNFQGNAVINTYDGNISVVTRTPHVIKAKSRYGEVTLLSPSKGFNLLKLTSINGNISVQETK